jgi:hypothetical protein
MTPTTPRKFTATPVTAGMSAGATAPAKAGGAAPVTTAGAGTGGGAAGGTTEKKRPWVLIGAIAVLVLVGVGVFGIWKWKNPGPPLLTAPTENLAKFILDDSKFHKLSFEKQHGYLDVMDQRYDDKECEKLWKAGKLTEMQMAELRDAAWMGKNMGKMQKYYSLPPGTQRKEYISKQAGKKFDDDGDAEEPAQPKPVSAEDEKVKVPKREKSWGKKLVATWPTDVQAQWKEYNKEIKKEEDRLEKEEMRKGTTKPTV